jgi:hypothetical protein
MADGYAGTPVDTSGYAGTPVNQAPQGDGYAGTLVQSPAPKPVSTAGHFGLGIRDVMDAAAGLPDMIAAPLNSTMNTIMGGGGANPHPVEEHPFRAAADKLADSMGLPTDATAQDRVVSAVGQGALQGLATSGLAGASNLPGIAGNVAKIVASSPILDTISGATSGLSSQVAAENGAGPFGQLAAGFAGGLAPSGVHIAAHAAGIRTPNTPAFVSDLFAQRGVDTIPTADPTTQPLQNRGMSPEDLDQYHNTLANGTPDQINQFYANSKMSNPGSDAVNQWVAHRDGAAMSGAPIPDPSFYQAGIDDAVAEGHRQAVEDHVNNITANWKDKPQYNVINSSDHPEGADPEVRGFYSPDGSVNIFADRAKSSSDVNAAVYHEGLGHYSLDKAFGANLDGVLGTLLDKNIGSLGKDTDAFLKENPDAYGGDRLRAAEEVLAIQSEKGQIKQSTSDALLSVVRRFGRKMGLDFGFNDQDVQSIMAMAHDAVINGKSVRDNGFKMPSRPLNLSSLDDGQNKFMYTGPKATGFDPEHPTAVTMNDGITRNEIADNHASIRGLPPVDGAYRLSDVLDHPDLFKQYPEIGETPVLHTKMDNGMEGAYSPKTKIIYLNSDMPREGKLSTLLHETQHAIQDHEGYPGTDTPEVAQHMTMEEYLNHPIEKEAFATEARRHWNTDERIEAPSKFMRRPLTEDPADVADEMYRSLENGYTPRYRSQADAQAAADERGINPGNLKNVSGVGNLDKRLFQYDNNAHALNTELSAFADKVNSGQELTGQEHARFIEAVGEAMYVRGRIDHDANQIGRGLAAMKAVQYSRNNLLKLAKALEESESGLEGLSDPETRDKFLKQYNQLAKSNNPKGAATMIKQLNKPNWEDYIITLHNNMMLSGLSTHVKAPQDMMIGIGRDLLDSMGALPISMAKAGLRAVGMNIKPGIHPAEVSARMYGVLKALLDGSTYKDTATTFINKGVNPTGIGGKQNARIPGISRVTDLISAQDAFFRAFATNMHLYGLAARDTVSEMRASGQPLKWDNIMAGMSSKAHAPSATLLKGARDAADQTLLLNKNAATEAIDRFKNSARGDQPLKRAGAFIANFLAPFIRVEANSLWTRTIRRSPLAVLDKQTMADLRGGGAAADIAMSRIIMGTASIAATWAAGNKLKGPISTWAAQMTGNKDLTGEGPDSAAKRAALEATGWRPDAVHENGQYNTGNKLAMSLNPFDQHNSTATMVNDMHQAFDTGMNKGQALSGVKLALMATMKQMADQSWISDIAPAVNAVTAPKAEGETRVSKLLSNEAGTMLPNAMSQYARVTQQNQPATEVQGNIHQSILNTLQGDIPDNSIGIPSRGQLPSRMTPFGEPVQSGASGFGQHGYTPQDNRLTGGNHTDETTDPAKQEIARLDSITNQPMVSPVLRTIANSNEFTMDPSKLHPGQITADGKAKLDNEQVARYQQLAGLNIVHTVQQQMNDPSWQTKSDLEKATIVRQITSDIKKAAREQLFGQQ